MATQNVTQTNRLAPFQEDFLADIFAQAEALKSTPMPFAPQQLAALSQDQQDAIALGRQGIGSYQPFMQQAQQALAQSGAFNQPGAAQQFMNPFEDAVVQQSMQDIARAGLQQQNQLSAQAAGAGAFGGSRQGIAQQELNRNLLDQQARTAAQLRATGFGQAQQAAQQASQLAGQQAAQFSALGGQAQQQAGQDINTLLGLGSLQQQSAQAALDVARQNALGQQALPFQQIGFMSDIFRGVPSLQQTSTATTTPPPSTTSQLLGLGIAGLGAAGSAGGFGNLFNFSPSPVKQ
tara:strand:+ start:609 stop:1484 length:876 start_codon:yes stop_codon:yes gene_type:complete